LWSQHSENEWVLEKGKNSSHETAFIILPKCYEIINPENITSESFINILDKEVKWIEFSTDLKLKDETNNFLIFSNNKKKFDWQILESNFFLLLLNIKKLFVSSF